MMEMIQFGTIITILIQFLTGQFIFNFQWRLDIFKHKENESSKKSVQPSLWYDN